MTLMSAQELEAQIGAISKDIEVSKELERTKSLLQRQLNDIRDPIARLPLEISSEIFLHCLSGRLGCGIDHIAILLLRICDAWTDIALSTPALWTALDIFLPCSPGFVPVLERWLERARNQPLDLRITITVDAVDHQGSFDRDIAALIHRHSQHLETLCIELREHASTLCIPFEATETQTLPSLRSLTISGHTASESGCPWSPLLQLVRRSPNLVNLEIQYLRLRDLTLADSEVLVFPNLRQLVFGRDPNDPEGSGDEFLRCITAPKLEDLRVWFLNGLSDQLLSFLSRSSPPLQILAFECYSLGTPTELLGRTHPAKALPNLQTLELQFSPFRQLTETWWNSLLPGLLARRTELRHVRIFLHPGYTEPITLDQFASPTIVSTLKELAASGMDFWIGPDEENLFSP